MALYIPHSIFRLTRLLYVRPETFRPYYVRTDTLATLFVGALSHDCVHHRWTCESIHRLALMKVQCDLFKVRTESYTVNCTFLVFKRLPFTTQDRVQSQVSLKCFVLEKMGNSIGFPLISVFPCLYSSTVVPYSSSSRELCSSGVLRG